MRLFVFRVFLFLSLVAGLTTMPGCGGKDAVTFNDNIVQSIQRLQVVGQKFSSTLVPLFQGGSANAAEVRQAHKESVEALAAVKADISTWKVPSGDSAQQLHQSFLMVLKTQDEAINQFGEAAKIVEDSKLLNQVKARRIAEIFEKLEGGEKAAVQDLQAKQQAFAKDFKIKLIAK